MCLFPWTARRCPDGGRPIPDKEGELHLPCGKCDECLTLRSVGWATRARHEISLHQNNCFLTLTYDDDNLPSDLVLKEPFQKFMKRLRDKSKKKLSYMVSHEYGSKTARPHHHCIIFGWEPKSYDFLKKTPSGNNLFTSHEISDLWKFGHHSIGEANEKTAFYISAYALKGKEHQIIHDGKIKTVTDSFDCSKRPAIGLRYLLENANQLVDCGDPLPRYYQKKLEEIFPDLFERYQNNMQLKIKNRSTQQRLAKLTISHQRKNMSDNEYRSAPDHSLALKYQQYLKNEINFFQGEKHETIYNPRPESRILSCPHDAKKQRRGNSQHSTSNEKRGYSARV